eukprot:813571-Pleurochrysis_carterae.AAC.2
MNNQIREYPTKRLLVFSGALHISLCCCSSSSWSVQNKCAFMRLRAYPRKHLRCISVGAADDVVGESVQRRGCVAVLLERGLGLVDKLLRHLARAVEPKQLGVGGLRGGLVLAR